MINMGLYKEGLKKGKLIGILFSSIMLATAIIVPLSTASSITPGSVISINHMQYSPLLTMCFCVFAPLMILYLFSFLNKRNRSDFYHSLPHKRETIFISYTLAALTWVIGVIIVSCSVTSLILLAFPGKIVVYYEIIIPFIFNCISAIIMVTAAILLAMSITGTTFSNIVVALLIIFMPRTIMYMFVNTLSDVTSVCPDMSFGILGQGSYNVPFGFITSIFVNNDLDPLLTPECGVYTLVLGLIYFAVALLLFKHRKSETAGTSAPGKTIQAIIRIMLAFLVSSVGCVALFKTNFSFSALEISLYFIAIIVYFGYEFISAKRITNIVKLLPGLLVLVLLNIAFVSGVLITKNIMLSVDWNPNNVESIKIVTEGNKNYLRSHEDIMLANTSIPESDFEEYILEQLTAGQEYIKNHDYDMYEYARRETVKVEMKDGKTYYRYLKLSTSEDNIYKEKFKNSQLINVAYKQLPEEPDTVDVSYIEDSAESRKIYEEFLQELKTLSDDDLLKVMGVYPVSSEDIGSYDPNTGITINAGGIVQGEEYASNYNVSMYTPKTFSKILSAQNENNRDNFLEFWEEFKAAGITENSSYENITISDFSYITPLMDQENSFYTEFSYYIDYGKTFEEDTELHNIIEKLDDVISKDKPLNIENGSNYLLFTFNEKTPTADGKGYNITNTYNYYLEVDKSLYDELSDYTKNREARFYNGGTVMVYNS